MDKDPFGIFKNQYCEYDEYSENLSSDIMKCESEIQKNDEILNNYILSVNQATPINFYFDEEKEYPKYSEKKDVSNNSTYFILFRKNSWCEELNDMIIRVQEYLNQQNAEVES